MNEELRAEIERLTVENHELRHRCGELRLAGAPCHELRTKLDVAEADVRRTRARHERVVESNKELRAENKRLRAWLDAVRTVVAEYRP